MKPKRKYSILDKIPQWLPFTRSRRLRMPVDQFKRAEILTYTSLLLFWVSVGALMLGLYSIIVGITYFLFSVAAFVAYVYLTCTKCPYYDKACYMSGGQCAKKWFRFRGGNYSRFEDLAVPLLWIGVSTYPVIFFIGYQAWLPLVIFLSIMLTWQILHKRNICTQCKNIYCALNPRFVSQIK